MKRGCGEIVGGAGAAGPVGLGGGGAVASSALAGVGGGVAASVQAGGQSASAAQSSVQTGGQASVQVFDEFQGDVCGEWLGRVCAVAVARAAPGRTFSVAIADDETARELNARYRGLDKTTDVLSFGYAGEGAYYGDGAPDADGPDGLDGVGFALPPDAGASLGELVISYPQAARQALAAGRSVRRELAALVAHGLLHLIGHDHMDPDDEAAMAARERCVMDALSAADVL